MQSPGSYPTCHKFIPRSVVSGIISVRNTQSLCYRLGFRWLHRRRQSAWRSAEESGSGPEPSRPKAPASASGMYRDQMYIHGHYSTHRSFPVTRSTDNPANCYEQSITARWGTAAGIGGKGTWNIGAVRGFDSVRVLLVVLEMWI